MIRTTSIQIIFLLLLAGLLASEEGQKPACSAGNRGEVWPQREHRNSCTAIEVCSYVKKHRYRWIPVTVNVSRLPKDPAKRSNCEVPSKTETGS
jgi:hypothetical protein